MSRENKASRRAERELDDLRKMGLAPLEKDVVTGQSISPHIPTTLAKAPWWYGASGPTLEHQRQPDRHDDRVLHTSADVAVASGRAATYHAGACENCGSRTHKTASCLQPKKKVGAVHTRAVDGHDIKTVLAPLTFEEKRNREATRTDDADDLWRAFEATSGSGGDDRAAKKARREDLSTLLTATASGSSSRDIGELPKYLENLETGQFYDPQTRSMRGNPHAPGVVSLTGFQGDNAKYETVDAHMFVEQQLHFLKGDARTVVDFAFDEQQMERRKKLLLLGEKKEEEPLLLVETGGVPPLVADDMLLGQSLGSSEESAPKAIVAPARPGEHSYVFGSYFDRQQWAWGYKCCRTTNKGAPCSASKGPDAP